MIYKGHSLTSKKSQDLTPRGTKSRDPACLAAFGLATPLYSFPLADGTNASPLVPNSKFAEVSTTAHYVLPKLTCGGVFFWGVGFGTYMVTFSHQLLCSLLGVADLLC